MQPRMSDASSKARLKARFPSANPTHARSDAPRGITQTANRSVTRMSDRNDHR